MPTRRAVVVGAGIGGLAAAVALGRVGFEVTICESAGRLCDVGAGLLLWPDAVRALDRLGLGQAVAETGMPATDGGLRTWRGDPVLARTWSRCPRLASEPPLMVHHAALQGLLLAAVRTHAGALRLGARCVGTTGTDKVNTVLLADGGAESFDVVVGADGAHSTVRQAIIADAPPRRAGYVAWRGVVPLGRWLVGPLHPTSAWGPGAVFGIAALSGNQAYWWAGARPADGMAPRPEEDKAALLERFAGWHDPIAELIEATPAPAILRTDLYERAAPARWTVRRVALLGDAAHLMLPGVAQGASQAIEDAAALADALADACDVPAALRAYEAARAPRAAAAARRARAAWRLGHVTNPMGVRLRDALLRAASPRATGRWFAPPPSQD